MYVTASRRLLRQSARWSKLRFSSARLLQPSEVRSSSLQDVTGQPLGSPLPHDEHACSVSLPTWSSVVGYEEGDPATTQAMKCGYPRFVYHPYVVQLMDYAVRESEGKRDCIVLPTRASAVRCQAFLQKALENRKDVVDNALIEGSHEVPCHNDPASAIQVSELGDIFAVSFPATTPAGSEAKAYWQHGGEVVSSRLASRTLRQLGLPVAKAVTPTRTSYHPCEAQSPNPHEALRERVAAWAGVPGGDHVFLTTSGMSSLYTALRAARRYHMEKSPWSVGGSSIVFGFPYLDTLKLCSRSELCPGGVEFFGHGDARDLDNLEQLLAKGRQSFSVLFTELPSNPLLRTPDLHRLRELADQYDFLLVVDDTISNFLNVDIIASGLADAVCSSLTKLVSGRGDAMAGSIVANDRTPRGRWLQQDLMQRCNPTGGLYEADACAMLDNSKDFEERNAIINANSEGLADWLDAHDDVEVVYYPKGSDNYTKLQTGGFGGLMSIVLHPHMCQRTFYDALNVAKGPSLGTNFTLVCPYTLLAHYHELDFAMTYGVQPNLIRIAVGMEDLNELKETFETAFSRSRLHPKLPCSIPDRQ